PGGQGPEQRHPELVGADRLQRVDVDRGQRLLGPHPAGSAAVGGPDEGGQDPGRLLERAALEQPGQAEVAVLGGGPLLGDLVVVLDEQVPGLELDQGGGQQQELGRRVEVEGLGAGLHRRPGFGQERLDQRGQAQAEHVELLAETSWGSSSRSPSKTGVWTSYGTPSEASRNATIGRGGCSRSTSPARSSQRLQQGPGYLWWRRPVSELKPATEVWVVQLSPSDAARLPRPGSGTGCGLVRRQWRRRSTQDQWRRKESDAERASVPQLVAVAP